MFIHSFMSRKKIEQQQIKYSDAGIFYDDFLFLFIKLIKFYSIANKSLRTT